jgi:hypothetical protein
LSSFKSPEFFTVGSDWNTATARDMYGSQFYVNDNPVGQYAGWDFMVPETG